MASGRREALILGGVGVAAALGGALAGVLALQSRSGAAELLAARFTDLEGQPRRLLEWQGRALLCNFWATWCAPCREEVPLLVAAKQQWLTPRSEIVGIGIDSVDKIRQFAATYKINYPLLVADATAVTLLRTLGNKAGVLPYTVGLDRNGAVAERRLGALKEPELRQVLARLGG
ncbi:MAG TPA: TlpA disulfide reductase family protein [Burkholderiales bacterium]|nr:TlpA disulfide reductase family protein [Burkholderiales bacterium]